MTPTRVTPEVVTFEVEEAQVNGQNQRRSVATRMPATKKKKIVFALGAIATIAGIGMIASSISRLQYYQASDRERNSDSVDIRTLLLRNLAPKLLS